MISIIVPVLNEEKTIEDLLVQLGGLNGDKEIIVVDGGSSDSTALIASKHAVVVKSQRGRAKQMNMGAKKAKGDILWFVHSDSRVHGESLGDIEASINKGYIGGGFSLFFYDYDSTFMRFVSRSSNLRARYLGLYYGDQGIFIKREIFNRLGGYPEIPIMEDWEFSLMVKKQGKMELLKTPIGTSGRRFKNGGPFKTLMLMHRIKLLHTLGVNPQKLSRMYREAR